MTLRVHIHAADWGGCGHYRMIWPALHVSEQFDDIEVTLVTDGQLSMHVKEHPDGHKELHSVAPIPADVLVLQRPLNRLISQAIPHIQKNGTAVVVELDDDFRNVHRQNLAWRDCQPKTSPDSNHQWLSRAARQADWFTCSTPLLASKYAPNHSSVIENYLPDEYDDVTVNTKLDEPYRVGWSGSVSTHPTDLQEASTFARRLPELNARLHVVGTGQHVQQLLGVTGHDMTTSDGWLDLPDYPQAMAHPHVGIVPLADIPFNHSKSWLKGLEFAGAGVPFIASNVDEYQRLHHQHGLGMIARRHGDWIKRFKTITATPETWWDEAQRQREYVLKNMMLRQHAREWANAWRIAAAMHRKNHGTSAPDDGAALGNQWTGNIRQKLNERATA